MSSRVRYRLQLLAAAALFSTGGAAIKAADVTAWQVASYRSGIAAVAVLLLVPAARRGWGWRVWVVGVPYAATLVLFVGATKLTTSANAIFLQSTAPLYVLLLGPWLLRERVRRNDLFFMAAVALGLALFFVGADVPTTTAPDPRTGDLLAVLSGVCWALTVIGLRWLGTATPGAGAGLATVAVGNIIACLAILPATLSAPAPDAGDWLVLGYLGFVQIALAYVLLTPALEHVPALEASTLLLAEPALNPIWAWLVHGEVPGVWALAGGALILAATLGKSWLSARPAIAPPRAPAPPAC